MTENDTFKKLKNKPLSDVFNEWHADESCDMTLGEFLRKHGWDWDDYQIWYHTTHVICDYE